MKRFRRRHRLDKMLKGWIINHAKRNYWRVASWYDLDDLIQDGFVCYCRCLEKYGHIQVQRHFTALVVATFTNHIHDLAAKKTRSAEMSISEYAAADCIDTSEALENLAGVEHEEQTLATLIAQLPAELHELIKVLANDARSFPMLRINGRRETTNEWLCRIAKLDPKLVNVEQQLREHFV